MDQIACRQVKGFTKQCGVGNPSKTKCFLVSTLPGGFQPKRLCHWQQTLYGKCSWQNSNQFAEKFFSPPHLIDVTSGGGVKCDEQFFAQERHFYRALSRHFLEKNSPGRPNNGKHKSHANTPRGFRIVQQEARDQNVALHICKNRYSWRCLPSVMGRTFGYGERGTL